VKKADCRGPKKSQISLEIYKTGVSFSKNDTKPCRPQIDHDLLAGGFVPSTNCEHQIVYANLCG